MTLNDDPARWRQLCSRRAILGASGLGVLALAGCGGGSKVELKGTKLDGDPAPDFVLTDQHGSVMRLSDQRGSALALAFIFTSCPDVCPAIAAQMRAAWDQLDANEQQSVRLLGVTVDPETDTPAMLLAFGERFELEATGVWHGLSGTRDELEQIWQAYGIDVTGVNAEVRAHQGGGSMTTIRHTDAIYVIDPDQRLRAFLRSSADPADLAADLRTLSKT